MAPSRLPLALRIPSPLDTNVMKDPRQIELLTDNLRERAVWCVSNLVMEPNIDPVRARSLVQTAITDALQPDLATGAILGYKVNVTSNENYKLGERNIEKDAQPGDKHGKTGIVLSSDGNGKGVVLDPLAPQPRPGIINVSIEVKAFQPLVWTTIEFSVGSE